MRIAIIEDHPMVSIGLKNLVQNHWRDSKIEIYYGQSAFELAYPYIKKLDLILADIHLEEINILDWLIELKNRKPAIPIILYTSSHPWEMALDKNNFPFDGYVQKNAEIQELLHALNALEQGKIYLDENLIWEKPILMQPKAHTLTKRELEILGLIKDGKTSKEMAEILFLSEFTIKSHRQNMMRKFEAKNVIELISKVQKLI